VKKTIVIIALAVLIAIGTLGGWLFGRFSAMRGPGMRETSPEAEPLRWVQHADVIADFRQHVEQEHDMRFLSRYGLSFASEFFGLTETPEIQQLIHKHGVRRLQAGDDIVTSAEEMDLQNRIGQYGTRYNNMLVGYLVRASHAVRSGVVPLGTLPGPV
jgi:hypothetical protein